jgi:deoxyribonuclease V
MILSPGHRVSPETAVRLVQECTRGYRLPEPTRQAHEAANRVRRDREASGTGQLAMDLGE